MNYQNFIWPLAGAALLSGGVPCAFAADGNWLDKNRIGLSYRTGFNISASFKNVGAPAFANNPSLNGVSYANGFVGTDSLGNAGGLTTYWGFQNAAQAQDNNAVMILRQSNAGDLSKDVDDGPYHGLELTYNRELGRNDLDISWGIEGAFNYTSIEMGLSGAASGGVLAEDEFSLGASPPLAPYVGPQTAGPFVPLLGTTATRLPVMVNANLDTSVYGFRVGPYLDVPLSKAFLLTLGAGLSVGIVDGELSYAESYTTSGGSPVTTRGRASNTDTVWGGYLSAQLRLALGKHVQAFTGLQYQPMTSYDLRAADKEVSLDFTGALYWSLGLSASF